MGQDNSFFKRSKIASFSTQKHSAFYLPNSILTAKLHRVFACLSYRLDTVMAMNKSIHITLIQSIVAWLLMLGLFACCYFNYNNLECLGVFALLWSFFILCIPAGHGQLLFGFPLRQLTGYDCNTEIILWPAALLTNFIIFLTCQELYGKTVLTMLLHRIISTPNPYWLIIIISACGTLYYFLVGEKYFACSSMVHNVFRHLLILVGIFYFCYAAHREFILLLNAVT